MRSLTLPFAILLSATAFGARCHELVAGWEGDATNGYAFVQPVLSFPQRDDGSTFVVRPTAGYLSYESRDVSGVTKVSSPGLSVGLAWRLRAPRLTFTVGPGFEQRWERRDQPDGTEIKNTQSGFTLSADVYFQANPLTSLSLITTYGDANQYRWSRGAIKRQITNQDFASNRSTSLGVEVTEQGNDDVRRDEIGGLLELGFLGARASVQMRGGYSRSHNRDGSAETRPYFGVGIYRQF
jgi:hypothetical protein